MNRDNYEFLYLYYRRILRAWIRISWRPAFRPLVAALQTLVRSETPVWTASYSCCPTETVRACVRTSTECNRADLMPRLSLIIYKVGAVQADIKSYLFWCQKRFLSEPLTYKCCHKYAWNQSISKKNRKTEKSQRCPSDNVESYLVCVL